MKLTRTALMVLVSMTIITLNAKAAAISLIIDTAGLTNHGAVLAFDLIDGTSSPSRATISGYASDGSLTDTPVAIGGITGSLADNLYINDTEFFNEYRFGILLGTRIQFSLVLAGNGPASNELPDAFSLFLLDPTSLLPIYSTSDPTGSDALSLFNIVGTNDISSNIFSPNVSIASQNSVPEPGTFGVFAATIGLLFLVRRSVRIRLLSALLFIGILSSYAANAAEAVSGWSDLTLSTSSQATGLVLNRYTNTYDSVLTVKNSSSQALPYPLAVVFQGIPGGTNLTSAFAVSSEGFPFSLAGNSGTTFLPGTTFSTVLKFSNPSNQRITFSYRILSPPASTANTLEIGGPDLNNNGVRDDIEAPIRALYATASGSQSKTAAGFQFARGIRTLLINQNTTDQTYASVLVLNKALSCMVQIFGDANVDKDVKAVRRLAIDTRPRVQAWLAAQNKLAGQSAPINFQSACEALQ